MLALDLTKLCLSRLSERIPTAFHARTLLLESPRNACCRALRRPRRLRHARERSLRERGRDRAERSRAPPPGTRHGRAFRHLRERAVLLSRAVAMVANRARAAGARAFAVRARPARLALLSPVRRTRVPRGATAVDVSERRRRFHALRTRAPHRDGVRSLSDVSPRMAHALAGGRLDSRGRRRADRRARAASVRRERHPAPGRTLAGGAVARVAGRPRSAGSRA